MKLFKNKKLPKMMIIPTLVFLMLGCDQNHDINEEKILDTALQNLIDAGNFESHFKSLVSNRSADGNLDEYDQQIVFRCNFDEQYIYKITDSIDINGKTYTMVEKCNLFNEELLSLSGKETGTNRKLESYEVLTNQLSSTNPLEGTRKYYADGEFSQFYEIQSEQVNENLIISLICTDLDGFNKYLRETYPEKTDYTNVKNDHIYTINSDHYITKYKYSNEQKNDDGSSSNTEYIEFYDNIGKTDIDKEKIDRYMKQASSGKIEIGLDMTYTLD